MTGDLPLRSPDLDPAFRPLVLARHELVSRLTDQGVAMPVAIGIEQADGLVAVRDTVVAPEAHPDAARGDHLAERLAKTLLWSRGGPRIWVDGPSRLVASLRDHYERTPEGRFDAATIGEAVYGRRLEVIAAPRSEFPSLRDTGSTLGGHLDGCRIGFDLGASDRKAAAVVDGQVVFSEEIAWDPVTHADPAWHLAQIDDSLRRAAAHLPRVDAIGGSSAGIYVDNEVRVASLFRAVPRDAFRDHVTGIFRELRARWGGIPFVVINDGDVTALAGAMAAGVGSLLGIALGSSEAAGYVRPDRGLTPWLNELAFVPIDVAPTAPVDDWSADRGCGAQYLSQQAVGRLLEPAGIGLDPGLSLPERLVEVQRLMAAGDERAARIYRTIGTYLGYALLEYRELYDLEHVLLLGRVTTGQGGEAIQDEATAVLGTEAPAFGERLRFHHVSERDKRHGQAVAAASLPELER